jgi:integrase
MCLYTGLRRGEVLGLKWSDLDLTRLRFTVRRTLGPNRVSVNGQWHTSVGFENPKTKASMRTLVIHDAMVDILNRHRARQQEQVAAAGNRWIDHDLVFSSSIGTPTNPSNLRNQYKSFLEEHHLRFVRIHDLRHTFAYLALGGGLPLEAVSQALGHTDINVTKSIYAPMVQVLNERVGLGVGDLLSTLGAQQGDPDRELLELVPLHSSNHS